MSMFSRGVLLIEGHLEGKTLRQVHQGGLVLARQCPGSPGTCNPEETGIPGLPISWSPDVAPSDYHLFPGPKKQLKGRHFSSDAEVIAAAETWLDWQPSDIYIYIYRGCHRRNGPNFGRVFLTLNYTDITQNTYIQSWTVTEIMESEVWNFDSCYTLIDYQIHIKTGRNMWFL